MYPKHSGTVMELRVWSDSMQMQQEGAPKRGSPASPVSHHHRHVSTLALVQGCLILYRKLFRELNRQKTAGANVMVGAHR